MLDQMFNADNFRRIFDRENRKGNDLASRFFPKIEPLTIAVRETVQDIRQLRIQRSSMKPSDYESQLIALQEELEIRRRVKSDAIDLEMERLSAEVIKPSFKISLSQKSGPGNKPVYCVDHEAGTYFVLKQIQSNLNRIYKVKQSNRHDLVSQFRDTVSTGFPYEVVRTDISSFYESVDRDKLLAKLDEDQLLSSASKTFIRQILRSYQNLSGSAMGIPRGVGISAYLAELYMRDLDRQMQAVDGIVLYCRYVDDIVAVFARPPAGKTLAPYENMVLAIIAKQGLAHNPKKTSSFNLSGPVPSKLEYLGYRFVLIKGQCRVWPSSSKVKKYYRRMKAAFAEYRRMSPTDPRRAYRELLGRIKLLTGNTRLNNSKSRATTGIYYNNPLVNQMSCFKRLDKYLKQEVLAIKRPRLRKRLKAYKFEDGFVTRRYHNFNTKELQRIVRGWKHV